MPIYEYRCGNCHRRVSLFFPSFSAADARSAAGENHCPRCGSADLSRLVSRFNTIRGRESSGDDDFDPGEDMPGMGGLPGMGGMGGMPGMGGGDDMLDGLDNEDPRAIARWARQMKDSLGDEADLGPEFDQALARIEAGEDPEKVMEDIDPEAMGGPGMDDDGGADDFGDDF